MQTQTQSEADVQGGIELLNKVLARSTTDLPFRQQLLSDPRAALAEMTGADPTKVPDTFRIVFVENKAKATVVLPDPIDPDAELGSNDLETVSGGSMAAGIISIVASGLAIWNNWKKW